MIEFDPTVLAIYDQDLASVIADITQIGRKFRDEFGDTTLARASTAIAFCANAERKSVDQVISEMSQGYDSPGLLGLATVTTYFVFKELEKETPS